MFLDKHYDIPFTQRMVDYCCEHVAEGYNFCLKLSSFLLKLLWGLQLKISMSAKEVVVSPVSVCKHIGWFVSRIAQKQLNGFPQNLDGWWVSAQNQPH